MFVCLHPPPALPSLYTLSLHDLFRSFPLVLRHFLLCLSIVFSSAAFAATTPYDESVDGDLSDDPSAPTLLEFAIGDNLVTATTHNSTVGPDYFTVNIAAGTQLDAAVLTAYSGPTRLFWGVAAATSLPATPVFGDLIGGGLIDGDQIGVDILDSSDSAGLPALALLGAGDYLFWFNETAGTGNTYTLNFQVSAVPLPPALLLLLPALSVLRLRRQSI